MSKYIPTGRPRGGPMPGSGRPKAPHTIAKEAAKKRIVEFVNANLDELLNAMKELAINGKSETARAQAQENLLNRAFGKPAFLFDGQDGEGMALGVVVLPSKISKENI